MRDAAIQLARSEMNMLDMQTDEPAAKKQKRPRRSEAEETMDLISDNQFLAYAYLPPSRAKAAQPIAPRQPKPPHPALPLAPSSLGRKKTDTRFYLRT
jgi:hypothetical protein